MVGPFSRGGPGVSMGQNTRQREEVERRTPDGVWMPFGVTTVTNSNSTLFTVPDNTDFRLMDLNVCNIAGAAITITIYYVPDGGSAANGNKVYDAYPVQANDSGTLTAMMGTTMEAGSTLVAVTSSATGANFWGGGEQFRGGLPKTS